MEITRRRSRRIAEKSAAASRNDSITYVPNRVLIEKASRTKSRKIQGESGASQNDGVVASITHVPDRVLIEKCSIAKSRRIQVESAASRNNVVVSSITHLPDHFLMEIFSRLSVKLICKCRSVCKGWFHLLKCPNFIQLHFDRAPRCPLLCLNHGHPVLSWTGWYGLVPDKRTSASLSLFEFERDSVWNADGNLNLTNFRLPRHECPYTSKLEGFIIVNSCNGFLCLSDKLKHCPVAIYNPVTGEYSILPIPPNFYKARLVSVFGLGFCLNTNQYKVLLMLHVENNCFHCEDSSICNAKVTLIYTLGLEGGGWRKVESPPPCFCCFSTLNPVFLNGALHWLVKTKTSESCEVVMGIMSFDFANEMFQIFQTPPGFKFSPLSMRENILGILRGHLHLCQTSDSNSIDIWVMKDYGHEKSWTKEYVYTGERWSLGSSPITDFGNNWELLLYSQQIKSMYFIKKHRAIRYVKFVESKFHFEVFEYVPSFLSIKTIVGDSLEVLNVRSMYSRTIGKV